jgi:hypothetical protein
MTQRMTGVRVSVIGPWLVTLALFAAVAGTAIVAALNPDFGMDVSTAGFLTLVSAWALVQSSVGTAIAWRQPDNPIGRLMQLTGPLIVTVFGGFLVGAIRYVTHGSADVLGGVAAWLGSTAIFPMIFLALPALGLLFPDGRLPGRAFRGPAIAVTATMCGITAAYAVARGPLNEGLPDNPFGLIELPPGAGVALGILASLTIVAGLGLAVAGVVLRWRRGSPLERAQLKWLLAVLAFAGLTFGPSFGSSVTDAFDLLSILSALLVPVAIGIAVLRYRLYEIDRLISRTVSWALVTAILVAAFGVGVVALQAVLAGFTQGQTLAVAASTLIAFALFQPIRRRVQSAVDLRFDRARVDAERTASAFARHLRDEVDLGKLRDGLVNVTGETVRPLGVSVWLRTAMVDEEPSGIARAGRSVTAGGMPRPDRMAP